MNNNNGREMKILVVAALIISIVAIGIGFAAFSETLTINGNASVQTSSWKVKFSELGTAQKTGTAAEVTINYVITDEKRQIQIFWSLHQCYSSQRQHRFD